MMVIEYGDEIILIDAGLMFPSDEMFGIDLVLPDFSYLKENKSKLKAIILTHGHEDHVGALSYLLKEVNVPVYGTRLTLGLVKAKLKDLGVHGFKLREIYPHSKSKLKIGSFKLGFMRVNHSIPDGVGLAITTPVGTIVHSGDFKIDPTPIDGKLIDLQKFQKEGRKGVLAFLSDSTNSEVKGFTMPEKSVGQVLFDIFAKAEGRILVASFASHIHRLQQVIDMASKLKRKVAISGRSMMESIEISS
ncbi:MAG: ribonuclease J, partial [Actinomycetia bacterium]|nr:ribonuclease J [Actinomycetes bacterium]